METTSKYSLLSEEQKEKNRAASREWKKKTKYNTTDLPHGKKQKYSKERQRDYILKLKYNLEYGDYSKMYQAQQGECAVCLQKPTDNKKLVVDHCHKTGKVRKLLCHSCNVGLGMFKDNPEILKNAAVYLEDQNGRN